MKEKAEMLKDYFSIEIREVSHTLYNNLSVLLFCNPSVSLGWSTVLPAYVTWFLLAQPGPSTSLYTPTGYRGNV